MAARLAALEKERQRLADELAVAQKQNGALSSRAGDLERQLADRDREIASLRSGSADSAQLTSQLSSTQGALDQSTARTAELERQLAALTAASGAGAAALASSSKTQTEADLAAAKQRNVEVETQLAGAKQRSAELEARLAAAQSSGADRDKLASECAAAKQRVAQLENQLADRDRELGALRGDLSAGMAKLKQAERGLLKALRPQIDKKNISVDLNNERLLINLASGYLFGSGEDELKPAGAEALQHVGAILKDYPEYKISVDGHTDNRPIRRSLKKKFPSNKELSEARAANAGKALAAGGLSGVSTAGYADTRPVVPNTNDIGRAQNRRVEIRVTR